MPPTQVSRALLSSLLRKRSDYSRSRSYSVSRYGMELYMEHGELKSEPRFLKMSRTKKVNFCIKNEQRERIGMQVSCGDVGG